MKLKGDVGGAVRAMFVDFRAWKMEMAEESQDGGPRAPRSVGTLAIEPSIILDRAQSRG